MTFFFQAEDGIRDLYVTGVQTCALPISRRPAPRHPDLHGALRIAADPTASRADGAGDARRRIARSGAGDGGGDSGVEIGRASCRERGEISVVAMCAIKGSGKFPG